MGWFTGTAGRIHYRQWIPAVPEALVVFFHGLGEHIGSYQPFAAALNAAGIAVWAADHAGHGHSDGERVLVEHIDTLVDDAGRFVGLARAAHPALPLVLAGHSLGSTVAALLAAERLLAEQTPLAGLVLAGSSLVPAPDPGSGLRALLASGTDPMDIRKDPGELTRDTRHAEQVRADPLTWQGGVRPATLKALEQAGERLAAVVGAGVLTVPVLLLHGGADDLAPVSGARKAAELLPNARLVVFAQDRHNILNELDRDEVYRVVRQFVRTVTGSGAPDATADSGRPV